MPTLPNPVSKSDDKYESRTWSWERTSTHFDSGVTQVTLRTAVGEKDTLSIWPEDDDGAYTLWFTRDCNLEDRWYRTFVNIEAAISASDFPGLIKGAPEDLVDFAAKSRSARDLARLRESDRLAKIKNRLDAEAEAARVREEQDNAARLRLAEERGKSEQALRDREEKEKREEGNRLEQRGRDRRVLIIRVLAISIAFLALCQHCWVGK